MREIQQWFLQYFDKAENILFVLLVGLAIVILWFFGGMIAPFLASLLLAYLLNSVTHLLVRTFKIKRIFAIIFLFIIFALLVLFIYSHVVPFISEQVSLLLEQIPSGLTDFQAFAQALPERYPHLISSDLVNSVANINSSLRLDNLQELGQLITPSLNSISSALEWLIYLFLVPIITFLLLKDKIKFKNFYMRNFPRPQGVMLRIAQESQFKLGRYLRGIITEATIVGLVYVAAFLAFRLNYAIVLGLLGGVMVFIPIIGTLIMTIPVLIVSLIQFGFSSTFIFLMIVYVLVHLLDAYVLVPWLFGKTLNLHPLVIIFALVVFGGLLGFWGLVFAIPLATFIKIVLDAYSDYGDSKRPPSKPLPYRYC